MNKDTSEPPFDYRNKYSVSYSPETGLILKVVRAGREYTDDFRGGTWYQVELWRGQQCSYSAKAICYQHIPGVGGEKEYRKTIQLKSPVYVDISGAKSEGEEPLILYESVFGSPATRKGLKSAQAEEYYAKIEREIASELKKKGHDGAVLYFMSPVAVPSSVFVVAPSFEKEVISPSDQINKSDSDDSNRKKLCNLQNDLIEHKEPKFSAISSYFIEAAGDIFRELACRSIPSLAYIDEKVKKLKSIENLTSGDMQELEYARKTTENYIDKFESYRSKVNYLKQETEQINLGQYENRKPMMISALNTINDIIDWSEGQFFAVFDIIEDTKEIESQFNKYLENNKKIFYPKVL